DEQGRVVMHGPAAELRNVVPRYHVCVAGASERDAIGIELEIVVGHPAGEHGDEKRAADQRNDPGYRPEGQAIGATKHEEARTHQRQDEGNEQNLTTRWPDWNAAHDLRLEGAQAAESKYAKDVVDGHEQAWPEECERDNADVEIARQQEDATRHKDDAD